MNKKIAKFAIISLICTMIFPIFAISASSTVSPDEIVILDIFAYSKDGTRTYIVQNAEIEYISSPLELLRYYCDKNEIKYTIKGTYLQALGGYEAGKAGKSSGWLHFINGKNPGVSGAAETLRPGDKLEWFFAVTKEQWSGTDSGKSSSGAEASAPFESTASSESQGLKSADSIISSEINSSSNSTKSHTKSSIISSSSTTSQSREFEESAESEDSAESSNPINSVSSNISGLYRDKYEEIIENNIKYLTKNPGRWTAFAMGSFGYSIPKSVSAALEADILNVENVSVLEYQRLYFNARAAGLDTSDLYKKAVDEGQINDSTLNALIFGGRVKYAESGGEALFTDPQGEYFLSVQKEDGSFALTEAFDGDIDITSMACAALFLGNDAQKSAALRGVRWLKSQDIEYSESAAQMLITGVTIRDRELCEIALTHLLEFENPAGGFSHSIGDSEGNSTSTEQALIALLALKHQTIPYVQNLIPGITAQNPIPLIIAVMAVVAAFSCTCVFYFKKRRDGSYS